MQRAALLLTHARQVEDAVALYLQCEDWQAVCDIVLRHAEDFLLQGRGEAILGWISHSLADRQAARRIRIVIHCRFLVLCARVRGLDRSRCIILETAVDRSSLCIGLCTK
jgi:hypothetical protein